MKKNVIIMIILLISGLLYAVDPVVENVRVVQRTDGSLLVDVYYDVTDANGDILTITLLTSDDNGATWDLPIVSVSGDTGKGVIPGTDKHIVWDFLADNPNINENVFQVKVIASDYGPPPGMVFVAGGTFEMGSNDGYSDEKPVHTVTLDGFYMDKYQVTNAQYAEFLISALADGIITANSSTVIQDGQELLDLDGSDCQISYNGNSFSVNNDKANHPVIEVTWYGANAYAKYFNKRLPKEAEWEFAARGGNLSRGYTYCGSDTLDKVGWYMSNSGGGTHAVGEKSANELGLYDMSGNVWEWCLDWYGSYPSNNANNPVGPSSGSYHVLRGGFWDVSDYSCRCTHRSNSSPTVSDYGVGFRCAMDLDTEPLTDIDGNVYKTVKIGDQIWMAENLRVTHYRNGDPLPNVTDNYGWGGLSIGAYCYYDNADSNAAIYGALYNWLVIDDERNIAPEGWHVPTDEEWKQLEMFLGMRKSEADDTGQRGTNEGCKLKETGVIFEGTGLWYYNYGATNESGFSARPGGFRDIVDDSGYHNGEFEDMHYEGRYWTATKSSGSRALFRYLSNSYRTVFRGYYYLHAGLSIRLVRD